MRLFAAGDQWSVALAQPAWGFPAHVRDHGRVCCKAQLQRAAALGGRAGGPGAFHERPAGRGIPRFRERALAAPCPGGIFRGEQPQALHACSGGLETRQVADCGDHGDRRGTWHAPEGLEGLAHRLQAPACALGVECLFQALEPFGLFVHSPDIVVKDDVRRRRWTHAFGEPPSVRWSPIGLAARADVMAEEKGFATDRGVREIAEGLFPGTREVAEGLSFHLGHIDGGERARAGQPGQWPGVSAVRLDALTGLWGEQRRCDAPAVLGFFRQRALEPGATGTRCRDEEKVWSLRWPFTYELIDVTLTRPNSPEGDHLSAVILGNIRHGKRGGVDLHADEEGARLRQG